MFSPKPFPVALLALLAACTESPPKPAPPPREPAKVRPESADPSAPRRPGTTQVSANRRFGLGPPDRQIRDDLEPLPEPAAATPTPPRAHAPTGHGPFGLPDAEALERLRTGEVTRVTKGSGGRTLAFRLGLQASDGTAFEAYFKPEQRLSSANWYAEVAAFYLDRALGLGRVPPVISRSLPWSQLEPAAAGDARVREIVVGRDGQVRGALIAWLPAKLVPAVTPPGWENWVRNEPWSPVAITPYQRAANYAEASAEQRRKRARQVAADVYYNEPPVPLRPELPAELSDMIVFDFLTLNYDRFGGDNANVLTLGENGPLIFLDNGDAFSRGPVRRGLLDRRLAPLSKFRKKTIDALRELDLVKLKAELATDSHGPILDAPMLRGLEQRRRAVLEHVKAQERRFGEKVYAW